LNIDNVRGVRVLFRTERISLSEIAIKAARDTLGLSEADARRACGSELPHTALHGASCVLSFRSPPHHQDPQIVAQIVCKKIPVVTGDEKFSL
jgi:PIN domain nuclease of toxin-antitoxin system